MTTRKLFLYTLIAVFSLFATSGVFAKKQELPEVTVDGLHRVPDSKLAIVYAEPGADLGPKDIEKIKNTLAMEFQTVFKEALEEAGYEVTDESGEDVMIVRPAIINLDVNAPDTPTAGRSTSFTASAGEMTLYIELYDSITGDIFAKALDRKFDRANAGFYTWTNSVTNRAAAMRILKGWAKILVDALNEAKTYDSGGESGS
jgi:hypothetical protein